MRGIMTVQQWNSLARWPHERKVTDIGVQVGRLIRARLDALAVEQQISKSLSDNGPENGMTRTPFITKLLQSH